MDPILERAVESGSAADLKAVSEWWASGLHTRSVDPAVARTLVERGATLSVHAAAGIGLTDHLARMLADAPALIDAKGCDACTPLHFARDVATARLLLGSGRSTSLCRTLLRRGADVNSVTGRDQMTPLMHALKGSAATGSSETVVELLAKGADVGLRNRFGSFALHLAAGCGASLETMRLLLRTGAAAHAHTENHFGYTPLRAATEAGHEDVAALLRELDSPPGAA